MMDEAIKIWAAKRLGVPRDQIERVDFDSRYVEGCPTCGGTVEHEAYVVLTPTKRAPRVRSRRIEFYDFTNVIIDILEIDREEVKRA